jgi:outer membrane protein assembly factor BamD (BamD/ComL family)
VALVDRARHALRQGRAGEAFDTLSLHQSRWPNGVLATEVLVLRVEAQLRLGQRASAQRDARAFVAVQPNSRYATRLRELFAPGELD